MFGKGGGPLNTWIKEFCELVFIQTLQAFIFALIIGFVISVMKVQTTMDQTDRNSALGIICIVALTSIFKVEEILRRIFGFGPTKADHGNAVQSIGKGMRAMHMGKNLLDNIGKTVGGATMAVGAHGQKVKAMKRYQKQLNALDKDNSLGGSDSNVKRTLSLPSENADKRKTKIEERDKLIQQSKNKENEAKNRRNEINNMKNGKGFKKSMSKSERNEEIQKKENLAMKAEEEAQLLRSRADEIQAELDEENKSVDTYSVSGRTTNASNNYNQKKLQYEEEYNAKKKEIDKQRRQGIKQMVSGVAETGAAMVGFTAGTAMSVASTNDWGDALKDGISWAGTADAVTAGAVNIGAAGLDFIRDRKENLSSIVEEYGENVASAYKAQAEEIAKADKQMSQDAQDEMKRIDNEYRNDAERVFKSSSGSRSTSKPSKVKAAFSGAKSTVMSHSVMAQSKILKETKARLETKYNPPKDVDRNIYN